MSQNRTFVLQAVAVTVLVGVVFFAFLRPSGQDDLAGIDAPGGEGPSLVIPGNDGKKNKANRAFKGKARGERLAGARNSALTAAGGLSGVQGVLPTGSAPSDDQYSSTATALLDQIRAPSTGLAR